MANPVNWNNVSMLTKGLKNLGTQINDWAPDRDGASDGAVGDYAHTQENSGHNPDDTSQNNAEWDNDSDNKSEVRAIDVDIDFNNGVSAQTLVNHIISLNPKSVIRYIIYNRKIYKSTNNWAAETYTGASPHTEHIHFSGAYSDVSDENTTYNFKLGDIPVALTDADKAWLKSTVEDVVWNHTELVDGYNRRVGADVSLIEKRRDAMEDRLNDQLAEVDDKLDEIITAVTPPQG